jgi:hypothetical protein
MGVTSRKVRPARGLELPAGEPGRQDPDALERMAQGQRRHRDPMQLIPHDMRRGLDDPGLAQPVLRVGHHVIKIHDELAPG